MRGGYASRRLKKIERHLRPTPPRGPDFYRIELLKSVEFFPMWVERANCLDTCVTDAGFLGPIRKFNGGKRIP
jgi:hypothetical protein